MAQRWEVTPVRGVSDREAEERTNKDVGPGMPVVHCPGDSNLRKMGEDQEERKEGKARRKGRTDHGGTKERCEREPGLELVPSEGEKVELAGEIERKDSEASEGERG